LSPAIHESWTLAGGSAASLRPIRGDDIEHALEPTREEKIGVRRFVGWREL